jgi:serine/threonine protein phosphatase PrpC
VKLTTIAFSMNGKVRKNNEDGFILHIDGSNSIFISSEIYNESTIYKSETISADTILAFVIDGMGGMGDGDIARDVILQSLQTNISSIDKGEFVSAFDLLLSKANDFLLNVKKVNKYKDMGAVVSSGMFINSNLYVSHIGDTRIYLLRDGKLSCLTEDHTYIANLIKNKKLSLEDAKKHPMRNMVLKSLGFDKEIQPDTSTFQTISGDQFLFLTDGVYGELSDKEIELIFKTDKPLSERVEDLLKAMLSTDCNDNFTGIILQILDQS